MKKKKVIAFYTGFVFFWLSATFALLTFFAVSLVSRILTSVISIILLLNAINLLGKALKSENTINEKGLIFIMPLVFAFGIAEVLAWWIERGSIFAPMIYTIFLVSGTGVLVITLTAWFLLAFQHNQR